jgi:hypothetical protein
MQNIFRHLVKIQITLLQNQISTDPCLRGDISRAVRLTPLSSLSLSLSHSPTLSLSLSLSLSFSLQPNHNSSLLASQFHCFILKFVYHRKVKTAQHSFEGVVSTTIILTIRSTKIVRVRSSVCPSTRSCRPTYAPGCLRNGDVN